MYIRVSLSPTTCSLFFNCRPKKPVQKSQLFLLYSEYSIARHVHFRSLKMSREAPPNHPFPSFLSPFDPYPLRAVSLTPVSSDFLNPVGVIRLVHGQLSPLPFPCSPCLSMLTPLIPLFRRRYTLERNSFHRLSNKRAFSI